MKYADKDTPSAIYSAGDYVVFCHPMGPLLDNHSRWFVGMVTDDDGEEAAASSNPVGVAYLDMKDGEPVRCFARVMREMVCRFYPDEFVIRESSE